MAPARIRDDESCQAKEAHPHVAGTSSLRTPLDRAECGIPVNRPHGSLQQQCLQSLAFTICSVHKVTVVALLAKASLHEVESAHEFKRGTTQARQPRGVTVYLWRSWAAGVAAGALV